MKSKGQASHNRPSKNLTCLVILFLFSASQPLFSAIPTGVQLKTIYNTDTISFTHPTWVGGIPGMADYLLVVQRNGKVFNLTKKEADYKKSLLMSVKVDSTTHWDGAWAIDFHPKFNENELFYIMYRKNRKISVIEEWKMDATGAANPKKIRDIITFDQKEDLRKGIHASADLKFGPDGYLYSAQANKTWNAQDKNLMAGKVIRIDVDKPEGGKQYGIPFDNPFVGKAGIRPEIWAIGLRMPWRMSFDEVSGDLIVADVGHLVGEEINLIKKGANYWARNNENLYEGNCSKNCTGFTNPIHVPSRKDVGCIIGGHTYRNDKTSKFYGVYLYGDWNKTNMVIYGLRYNETTGKFIEAAKITDDGTKGQISTIGSDDKGRIFAAAYTELGSAEKRKTHIYLLSHPELREKKPVSVISQSYKPSLFELGPNAPRYNIQGVRLPAKAGHGLGNKIFLTRNPETGKGQLRVDLQ